MATTAQIVERMLDWYETGTDVYELLKDVTLDTDHRTPEADEAYRLVVTRCR